MLTIYVDHISTRLLYTLNFVLDQRGVTYHLCNDFMQFGRTEGVKLNYSERFFENTPQIVPSSLVWDDFLVKTVCCFTSIGMKKQCAIGGASISCRFSKKIAD